MLRRPRHCRCRRYADADMMLRYDALSRKMPMLLFSMPCMPRFIDADDALRLMIILMLMRGATLRHYAMLS